MVTKVVNFLTQKWLLAIIAGLFLLGFAKRVVR